MGQRTCEPDALPALPASPRTRSASDCQRATGASFQSAGCLCNATKPYLHCNALAATESAAAIETALRNAVVTVDPAAIKPAQWAQCVNPVTNAQAAPLDSSNMQGAGGLLLLTGCAVEQAGAVGGLLGRRCSSSPATPAAAAVAARAHRAPWSPTPPTPPCPAALTTFMTAPSAASPQRCCFSAPLAGNTSALICMTPAANITRQLADSPITKARAWGGAGRRVGLRWSRANEDGRTAGRCMDSSGARC